ncbi:MAG: winged helix-turn-helix domain-containing protein [Nitrososphaerales archaeon]
MIYRNRSRYRSKLTIMLKILSIARVPVRRSYILTRANLNSSRLASYLDTLIADGLIEPIESPFKGYLITSKGLELLAKYESITD